jgi:spore coat protein CotH
MFRIRSHMSVTAAALVLAAALFDPAHARAQSDAAAALFDDTVVHDIQLTISARDWASLKEHFTENTRYPADLRWRDQVARNVGVRSRGNGSRSVAKPGLKLDINYYSTEQRFAGLKNLVLRNNTQDASNMRELVSMKFFRRMNVRAPRESFARLFVNTVYVGLYTIVEDIDKDFLASNLAGNDGYLYEHDFDEGSRTPTPSNTSAAIRRNDCRCRSRRRRTRMRRAATSSSASSGRSTKPAPPPGVSR